MLTLIWLTTIQNLYPKLNSLCSQSHQTFISASSLQMFGISYYFRYVICQEFSQYRVINVGRFEKSNIIKLRIVCSACHNIIPYSVALETDLWCSSVILINLRLIGWLCFSYISIYLLFLCVTHCTDLSNFSIVIMFQYIVLTPTVVVVLNRWASILESFGDR